MSALCVLHLSPHPDDEAIAAPATLLALRDAGHRVINLACGLGRPADRERRRAELEEATRRARLEVVVHDPASSLEGAVAALVERERVSGVISPRPEDGHPAHEAVGRAASEGAKGAARWWMWGLWAELRQPTLVTSFDEARLEEVLHVLAAYEGELARNDYAALVRARAVVNRVLGAERVFGFGSRGLDVPYAELLTELEWAEGGWRACRPRLLDPSDPLAGGGA